MGSRESYDFYSKAREIDPFLGDAYTSIGHYFHVRGDEKKSNECFSVAAELNRCVSSLLDLATVHLEAERLNDARDVLSDVRAMLMESSARLDEMALEIEQKERIITKRQAGEESEPRENR